MYFPSGRSGSPVWISYSITVVCVSAGSPAESVGSVALTSSDPGMTSTFPEGSDSTFFPSRV